MIVCFYCLYWEREPLHYYLQKLNRVITGFLIKDLEVSPSARSINCGVLMVLPTFNRSRNVFDVNLDEFTRLSFNSEVFVLNFLDSVLLYQSFIFENLSDGTHRNNESLFLELPMNLLSAESCFLSVFDHPFFKPNNSPRLAERVSA